MELDGPLGDVLIIINCFIQTAGRVTVALISALQMGRFFNEIGSKLLMLLRF